MGKPDHSDRRFLDALDYVLASSIAYFVAGIVMIPLQIVMRLFEMLGIVLVFIAVFSSVWAVYHLSIGINSPAINIAILLGSIAVIVLCYRFQVDSEGVVEPRTLKFESSIKGSLLRWLGHSKAPPKVRLRLIVETDLAIFFEHQQHQPSQYMAAFIHENPSDRAAFDAHWAKLMGSDKALKRSIEANGQLVGHIMSFETPNGVDGVERELTYWIDQHHWGKGIATEALRRFLLVETRRPLFGRAALDNTPSIGVLEHNAFQLLRRERGYANARGQDIDEVVMMLERTADPA